MILSAAALLVSLLVLTSAVGGYASSMTTRDEQEAYLKRYAYLGSSSPDPRFANMTGPDEMFEMAVMKFQMMAGINETGIVCNETMKMMEMPRCGLPDEVGMSMIARRRRRRRYTTIAGGRRWAKTELTYRINNYTPDLPKDVIDKEIQKAFERWSEVSPLTFTKVTDLRARVDIKISFGSRDHGDGTSFDGRRGVLAHAYSPQSGQVHFDEDEIWKTDSDTDLRWVAIHEFGHSLGLGHSDVKNAIMYPFYMGYRADNRLHSDDIAGIRYIYRNMMTTKRQIPISRYPLTTPRSLPAHTTRIPSAICSDSKVDAIFAVDEDVYVFKGNQYFMIHRLRFLSSAKTISDDWKGLPNNIDTAVYLDGSIVVFKDHQCWRYNSSRHPIGHNPQSISTVFSGLPSKIDAAFVWSGNGKLYFIKDDKYYRMSKRSWFNNTYRVDPHSPQPLRIWKGLPSKIDAAFGYTNSRTYFFSNSSYYRFNDFNFTVDSGYPKSTATHWLGCPDRLQSADNMMEVEWMAGGDQFMAGEEDQSSSGGVGLSTYSVFLPIIAVWALCLV